MTKLENTPYIRSATRAVLRALTPEQVAEMRAAIRERERQQRRVRAAYQLTLWRVENGKAE